MALNEFAKRIGYEGGTFSDLEEPVNEAGQHAAQTARDLIKMGIPITREQIEHAVVQARLRAVREIRGSDPEAFEGIITTLQGLELRADQKLLVHDGISSLERARDQWRREASEQRSLGNQDPIEKVLEDLQWEKDPEGKRVNYRFTDTVTILSRRAAYDDPQGKSISLEPATTIQVMKALKMRSLGHPSYTQDYLHDMITKYGTGITATACFQGATKGDIYLKFNSEARAAAIRRFHQI